MDDKPDIFPTSAIVARTNSAQFGRGGDPRYFGGGLEVLDHYSMIFWDAKMHRALIPSTSYPTGKISATTTFTK